LLLPAALAVLLDPGLPKDYLAGDFAAAFALGAAAFALGAAAFALGAAAFALGAGFLALGAGFFTGFLGVASASF
jgi:hypothetical protein